MNFVTLTYARSGSSFFQRLLNSHPQIGAAQEMLRGPLARGEKPWTSINYFYNVNRTAEVLGFKMFYSHNRPRVWKALMAIRPKPKVIQLIREDLLETVMLMPGMYDGDIEGGMGPPLIIKGPITLKIDLIIKEIQKLRKDIEKHRKLAGLVLTYEELTGGKAANQFHTNELRQKVLSFLGVDDKGLKSEVNKKNTRPPNEEVFTNWKEMLAKMKKRGVERYYRV